MNHRPVTSAREADVVDLDALLTAQRPVQGSFFLNDWMSKERRVTRLIGIPSNASSYPAGGLPRRELEGHRTRISSHFVVCA